MLPCQLFASFGRRNRDRNAIMRAAGGSIGAIARALRRTKSTVLRELLRNALPQNLVAVTPAVGRETRALR
jgi:IS30 family transposase